MNLLPVNIFSLMLFAVIPAFAQQAPWEVSSSSVAVLAAESVVVYRGAPAGSKADTVGSNTSDIVVVNAVENDGLWTWTILPLSTGTVSFSAKFASPDGRSVAAPAAAFAVTVAPLPDSEDISDIKGPIKARPALWPWLLAAALAWAAWRGWRRWKARRLAPDGTPLPEAPVLPPEEIAAMAIAALRSSGLWENDQAAYYLRLTDILRAYLEARYGQPVTAMTSVEVERLVKARAQDLQIGGGIRELLTRADLVKFAKAKPGPDEGPRDADLALGLIKATTPRVYAAKETPP
ncbi:MAG: hypothetical protein Q8T11_11410 [Elusimicrobiota bacterium]|nr:hypothetical protein [Elusimicrobiota bacterium]